MRIAILQHAAFEGPGFLETAARDRSWTLQCVHLYRGDPFPARDTFDMLAVMGGPMNIYQFRDFPWLPGEIRGIRETAETGKPILGVCLGAQLLADAMGGKVHQNPVREIGWFPVVTRPVRIGGTTVELPRELTVLHWHGDTFELPLGAEGFASSPACANQAFVVAGRAVGLQFHLEATPETAAALVENCRNELVPGQPWVAPAFAIREGLKHAPACREALNQILDALAR